MTHESQLVVVSGGWDRRFLELAAHIATWSKDPSTKVGCVLVGADREVLSTGFNGFPRGLVDSEERLSRRDIKYSLVCHGEENAMYHAARIGVSLKGCTAYCTWPPCIRCARAFVQVGVKEVVCPSDIEVPDRWKDDFELSNMILDEAGVSLRTVDLHSKTTLDVAHCGQCDSYAFEAHCEVCTSCGGLLDPVSKQLELGKSYRVEDLKG